MLDCIHPHENPICPVFLDLEGSETPNRCNESIKSYDWIMFVVISRADASRMFDKGSWNEILE